MNSISFHNVTKRFGRLCALDDVSVTMNSGQVVLLAGPNGAGKSTIINILLGLYLPDGGEIRVDGAQVSVDNRLKAMMGYLPENVAFSENLSGWAMMSFFARARGVGRQRMREVMERIGLSRHARRSISGYSKGMRQRLALGISILHDPEILVLDEPTSGLDQEGLGVLWTVIDEWRGKDRLTLISSHDLGILEKRVDQFCILRDGSVVACDGPQVLRRESSLPVSILFTLQGDEDGREAFLAALRSRFPDQSPQRDGETVRVEVAPDLIVDLMRTTFAENRCMVEAMRVREPELEDIYEHLLQVS